MPKRWGRLPRLAGLGYLALIPGIALAQTPPTPDTGSLLRDIERAPEHKPLQELPEIQIRTPGPTVVPDTSIRLTLTAVEFSGNQVISSEVLEALAAPYLNRSITFADLEQLIAELTGHYWRQGYLTSRAYLPAQEIADGKLRINILEGKLASPGISLRAGEELRLKQETALGLLRSAIPEGQILTKSNLERGLLLLDDLPGIVAKSTLVPGATSGTSELLVDVGEGKSLTGSLEADNYGGRYTGEYRAGGSLQFNDPGRVGDLAGIKLLSSGKGLNYLHGFYQRPVGFHGTSFGIEYSWMDYSLGEEFRSDQVDGSSQVYGLSLNHPITRGRERNLAFSADYAHKRLSDEVAGIKTKERDIDVIKLSLNGYLTDHLYNTGVTEFSASVAAGRLDLSDVPSALATDAATARTDGDYHLLGGRISHNRYLSNRLSLFAALQGQIPSGNLDSSEKFYLGGAAGVRAYPQGEASGDAGYLLNAELRFDMNHLLPNHRLQTYLFIDHGRIWLHETTWVGWQGSNPALENSYSLSGAGIGMLVSQADRYFIRTSYGWPIGDNKGVDVNGNDIEGQSPSGQFWLQASYRY